MPSTISAGTTAGTAIAIAGDTTGNLAFQTNGTTTAMTIDTSQNVGIGTTSVTGGYKAQINGNLLLGTTANPIITGTTSLTLYGDNSASSGMRIDSAGRVTMSAQPCFHARVNSGAYITTSPIPFSNAPINIGSNFNTSTYRFTAPIAGRYYFILMLYVRLTGSGDITCYVRVNDSNRQYLNYIIGTSTTEYNSITMPSIFSLSAGDYVDYTFTGINGAYYGGNQETNLFGYLLG